MSSSSSPDPGRAARDPYAAFRHGAYRFFLGGRLLFLLGSQMQTAAVGWLLYERFGTTMALAYVGIVQIVPIFVFVLPAGHLADRFDRRAIILCGQAIFLTCSLGMGLLSLFHGPPGWIYVFLFFLAVGRVFTMPAMGALLPMVLPREALGNATTWNSSLFELSGLVGPAAAGLVIALGGSATPVFFIATTCSLVCMALFGSLRYHGVETALAEAKEAPAKATEWRDIVGGLHFMVRNRLLFAAASLDLFAVLFGGVTALLPVVAKDILHAGPQGFGWLRAAPSVGAMAMAVVTAYLPPWKRAGRVLFLAFVGFGLAVIVFGLSTSFWLSFAMLVLTGVFDNLNVVIRQTLIQYLAPNEMRGRITSINFLFIGCSNELGSFESGLTARLFGTVPAIVLGGIGTLATVTAVMRFSPGLRKLGPLHEVKVAELPKSA
ncbi:Transmembrane secretion effector [Verrucomicrobium sp. GAS474]|uniref:MFS transporter n=1 Tax=Verrucomicrobium sp. GAS474 TaxID=1882831 RepID=UPI00087A8D46|nr:MFS transporter [Verrucomicrobium sp. GAS474]SDU07985.1 Transmembrane secretion effector [Verrucomicrobium sp. GAS474]